MAFTLSLLSLFQVSTANAGGSFEPTGACCQSGDCFVLTEINCSKSLGEYQGDGSVCGDNTCDSVTTTTIVEVTTTTLPEPVCGNETQEVGEECDDGGQQPGDGCSADCLIEFCGDGTSNNNGEECDDGNTDSGDGCNAICEDEFCGDGIDNDGLAEECDDGDTDSGDGCSATCVDEFCGDGSVNDCPPILSLTGGRIPVSCETCDDGNTTSGDGCNSFCIIEFCGDGVTNNGEECDDGNTNDVDDCTSCELATCGDGSLHIQGTPPFEECDDGNTDESDDCSNCQDAECGDGTVNVSDGKFIEECDDGGTAAGDGCDANCDEEFCGDGITNDTNETCDDGNTNDFDDCTTCQLATCGDGSLHIQGTPPFEECDGGNSVAGDGCDAECQDEFCGDGIVNDDNGESMEECDDGNTDDSDFCVTGCVAAACGDEIINISNGETIEDCDDGNTEAEDGCSPTCTFETGACCHGSSCTDDVTSGECDSEFGGSFGGGGSSCEDAGICVACGDGNLQFGEECEDGGSATGDGCDAGCQVEECWTCTNNGGGGKGPAPIPSDCEPDVGAECDDGEICTLADECNSNGDCTGAPPIIPAACDWVMVAGNADRPAQSRTRGNVVVLGDICGNKTRVGEVAAIEGDVVATANSGIVSQFGAAASVVGDIITGGGTISGRPKIVLLPGLNQTQVAGGSSTVQSGDPSRDLDATGMSPRVDDCQDAIDSIVPSATLLDALPATQTFGKTTIPNNGSLTINATSSLNVIDFERLNVNYHATLELNGGVFPDAVFIIRVAKKTYLKLDSVLALTGTATPERTILYGKTLCKVGQQVTGAGTIFCPNNKVKVDQNSSWEGALISGRKRIDLRHAADLTHAPLQVGVP